MSSQENGDKNGSLSLPFVLFILNIVVIANTTKDNFNTLGYSLYYDFQLFNLIIIGVFFGYYIIYMIGQVKVVTDENKKLSLLLNIGMISLIASYMIVTLYYMGEIWHQDPRHSIFFYPEYWKESVMDFSCLNVTQLNTTLNNHLRKGQVCRVYDKKWAYIMSDVVIRIYSFIIMMILSIVLPIIVCCLGIVKVISKTKPVIPK